MPEDRELPSQDSLIATVAPADHALGVELELRELVSRADEARHWGHEGQAQELAPEIGRLRDELAEISEGISPPTRPVFHGARRARDLVSRR